MAIIVVMAWLCRACRVFHKPLLVHVLSETWGMGMHLYLRAIGFQHAVMGVSHPLVILPGFAQNQCPSCQIVFSVSFCCKYILYTLQYYSNTTYIYCMLYNFTAAVFSCCCWSSSAKLLCCHMPVVFKLHFDAPHPYPYPCLYCT